MAIDYIPPPEAELVNPPALVQESVAYARAACQRQGDSLIFNSPGGVSVLLDDFFHAERVSSSGSKSGPEPRPEAGPTLYQTRLELVDGGSNTFSFLVEDRHGHKVTDGSRLRAFFSEGGEFFAVSGIEADGKIIVELFQTAFDALADGEYACGTLTVLIGEEEYFIPMVINSTPTPGYSI